MGCSFLGSSASDSFFLHKRAATMIGETGSLSWEDPTSDSPSEPGDMDESSESAMEVEEGTRWMDFVDNMGGGIFPNDSIKRASLTIP